MHIHFGRALTRFWHSGLISAIRHFSEALLLPDKLEEIADKYNRGYEGDTLQAYKQGLQDGVDYLYHHVIR